MKLYGGLLLRNDGTLDYEAVGEPIKRIRDGTTNSFRAAMLNAAERVRPGDVVLDVGGHIGSYAVSAALAGAKRVVSVEPALKNYTALWMNARAVREAGVGEIVPVHGAVMSAMADERTALRWSGSSGQYAICYRDGLPLSEMVDRVTLAELDEEYGPFDVMKMDVEGGEWLILGDDARPVVEKMRHLSIETHGFHENYYDEWMRERADLGALSARLRSWGFEFDGGEVIEAERVA